MKADISRDTFPTSKRKHISKVLFQQGRVTLDADLNEQADLLLHYLRQYAEDIIGNYGSPKSHPFHLKLKNNRLEALPGRIYVDGILVDYTEEDHEHRPYVIDMEEVFDEEDRKSEKKFWFVFLDVWERLVTSIEEPYMRELALRERDTCARSQVVWRIRAVRDCEPKFCPERDDKNRRVSREDNHCHVDCTHVPLPKCKRPTLKARVEPSKGDTDSCIIPPESKYRGLENQLYRVELFLWNHEWHFKWSRDNGSIVTGIEGVVGSAIEVNHARGFEAGCWVELTDDRNDRRLRAGHLVQVMKVEGNRIWLSEMTKATELALHPHRHPKIRRWDQGFDRKTGLVKVVEGSWLQIEDGLQVQFEDVVEKCECHQGHCRNGDYWLIPARVATGSIEWPKHKDGDPCSKHPDGIHHHYAPLGFCEVVGCECHGEFFPCECVFEPLTHCCECLEKPKGSKVEALTPGVPATEVSEPSSRKRAAKSLDTDN